MNMYRAMAELGPLEFNALVRLDQDPSKPLPPKALERLIAKGYVEKVRYDIKVSDFGRAVLSVGLEPVPPRPSGLI